ncbi:hypothetical protein [Gracilinema caldarium]|uniref:hypothetical protein n=1 Tax=Gracilinema caldarium TaxID=215591 RepID=UPI0026ECB119|nr:hypothetical protein [Gracilinema caldarium]
MEQHRLTEAASLLFWRIRFRSCRVVGPVLPLITLITLLALPHNLSAQSFPVPAEPAATTPAAASASPTAAGQSPVAAAPAGTLPLSYRSFSLGMGLEDLKKALAADSLFAFRGDRDVSLLPMSEQTLVETTGLSFIKRAFFQLKDSKVFIMAFTLNTDIIDHYSVFTTLVQKYGEPTELNPREAVWRSETVRLSIERPLTVKYIDLRVFNSIVEESTVKESKEAILRREFLNDF